MSLKMFVSEAMADFSTVAAISPSSNRLVSAMLEPLPLLSARTIVELGAGTGAMTRALLDEMSPRATLVAFELNRKFFGYLKRRFSDSRLVLINASANNIDFELRRRGYHHADAVVSSLGLGLMPDRARHAILRGLRPFLHRKSVMTQYQYIHGLQFENGRFRRLKLRGLLGSYFASVESRIIWRNLPPAFVFSCYPASRLQ